MRESCPLQRFGFCYYPPVFNAFFPLTSPVPFRDCTLSIERYCLKAYAAVFCTISVLFKSFGFTDWKKWRDHFNIPPTRSTVTFCFHCRSHYIVAQAVKCWPLAALPNECTYEFFWPVHIWILLASTINGRCKSWLDRFCTTISIHLILYLAYNLEVSYIFAFS